MNQSNFVIGVIIMSGSARLETYLHRCLPKGVDMATTRVPFDSVSHEGLLHMIEAIPDAARTLSEAIPDIVIITSFTASCIKGQEICNIIQQATGAPVVTPAAGFIDALQRLHAHNIAIVSAFSQELNLLEKMFFYQNHIHVTKFCPVECISPPDPRIVSMIEPQEVLKTLRQSDFSDVDAILIDVPIFLLTPDMQAAISRLTSLPVLTMSEVLLWSCLKKLGVPRDDLYLLRFLP